MVIIVGLGNPEKKYDGTRHNAGFAVIDQLAARYGIDVNEKNHKGLMGKGIIEGNKCILLKPLTYMNKSGESIVDIVQFYKIDPATELLVISDDIALAPGNLRIRKKGSAGGHNGLKNIIQLLGTDGFLRLRVGVGEKAPERDLIAHVLGHFDTEEEKIMAAAYKRAADAVVKILETDADSAMNVFNQKTES